MKHPYNVFSDKSIERLKLKRLSYQVIVKTRIDDELINSNTKRFTTSIMSKTKNDFIDDCLLRGVTESDVLRNIIKLHYDILQAYPQLKGQDFKDIKLFILTK